MAEETVRAPRRYSVAQPQSYSITSAEQERGRVRAARPAAAAPEAEARAFAPLREKRAVWIVHGMGQQLPFETLDGLAQGLIRQVESRPGAAPVQPRVRAVKLGDQIVERVELDATENGRAFELHLYEAYWAPITEGAVKLRDVTGFLFTGSFRGLLNSFKKFRRAMFGGVERFQLHQGTAAEVSAALLTLVSLVVINSVIVAAGAVFYALPGDKMRIPAESWSAMTAIASGLSAVGIIFGALIFLAEMCKPQGLPDWAKWVINRSVWTAFFITLLSIALGALFLALRATSLTAAFNLPNGRQLQVQGWATFLILCIAALSLLALALRGKRRSDWGGMRRTRYLVVFVVASFLLFLGASVGQVFIAATQFTLDFLPDELVEWMQNPMWVWPFLIGFSYLVRELLVQYVGDVAAYISPSKLDRFSEIRVKIKDLAKKSATGVYFAKEGGDFLYQKIAVVGHSLGSVIAYDTLNALLNEDSLCGNVLQVADRTCLLETFGSPLDKIAFFFSIQGSKALEIREQLASAKQPLIQNYAQFRQFPWVNVYSPNDIVSGRVEFYDRPGEPSPPAVERIEDKDAIVPLAAHVEYWSNSVVWERLYAELTR